MSGAGCPPIQHTLPYRAGYFLTSASSECTAPPPTPLLPTKLDGSTCNSPVLPRRSTRRHPHRFYAHHDCDYGVANAYQVADPRSHSRSCSFGGISSAFREAAAARRRKFHHLLPNLASRRLAPFRGAVEGATEPGQVCGFPSPHPDQGLIHRLTKTELTAVVTRSMLPACVVLAGRNCRLLRTKQQLAWLCEMPPTRGYPHP